MRKTKAVISCVVTVQLIYDLFLHIQRADFLMAWLIFFRLILSTTFVHKSMSLASLIN